MANGRNRYVPKTLAIIAVPTVHLLEPRRSESELAHFYLNNSVNFVKLRNLSGSKCVIFWEMRPHLPVSHECCEQ